ncbi:MAG: hypothetical protein IPO13_09895 [Rhodocyclaceae bacterium]|nr:hypothetical protein [Rhodocyclaceae bacterium]
MSAISAKTAPKCMPWSRRHRTNERHRHRTYTTSIGVELSLFATESGTDTTIRHIE